MVVPGATAVSGDHVRFTVHVPDGGIGVLTAQVPPATTERPAPVEEMPDGVIGVPPVLVTVID